MKKIQLIMLVLTLMCMLSGCANYAKEYDKNTLVIKRNGSLVEVAIEDFKDSSVKADDLVSYIDDQISDYNERTDKNSVKQLSIDTEDMSKVKLVLKYKDIESYNGFNTLECVLQNFADVKESRMKGSFKSVDERTVKISDMENTDKATVLITSEKADIIVSGDILYYNDAVEINDGVATTSGDEDAIIIFK